MTTEDHIAIAEQVARLVRPLKVLRAKDAAAKLSVSRAKFYEMRKEAGFPAQVQVGSSGVVGYWEHEIDAWMREHCRR